MSIAFADTVLSTRIKLDPGSDDQKCRIMEKLCRSESRRLDFLALEDEFGSEILLQMISQNLLVFLWKQIHFRRSGFSADTICYCKQCAYLSCHEAMVKTTVTRTRIEVCA